MRNYKKEEKRAKVEYSILFTLEGIALIMAITALALAIVIAI